VKFGTNAEMTGEGFENLAGTRVHELDLSNTGINDAGLAKIAEIKDLKKLLLPHYGNGFPLEDDKPSLWSDFQPKRLTDAGLKHLVALQSLENLSMGGGGITDAGLESIGKITSLTELAFHSCPNLHGSGLSHLDKLKNLRSLNVTGAMITTDSLKLLDKLPALEYITVGPLISPEFVKEYEKSHAGRKMFRQEEYYTPTMKALQKQHTKPEK
jgi:hypothetical protein